MLPLPQVIELDALPSEFAALWDFGPRRPAPPAADDGLLDPAWAAQAPEDEAALVAH